MNEQITSAAELDALPVGSVVLDAYAAACTRVRQQDMYDWVRASSAAPNGGKHFHPPYFPATVLYRPDRPQRVQPSREDVARLLAHQNADWIHGYLGADPATGETHDHGPRCSNWEPYAEDADAVLALFAQQPTVAEVKAEAWDEGYTRGFYDREALPGDSRDAAEGRSQNPYEGDHP